MNTATPFSSSPPVLKLARRAPPAPAAGPAPNPEIAADLAALGEREKNLREYEARLRDWQERLDAASGRAAGAGTPAPFFRPGSQSPFQADPALEAAWEKFHRARALFEAEQNQLRDDRMTLRGLETALRRREAEIEAREARMQEREMVVGAPLAAEEEPRKPRSTLGRLTRAPWAVFKSAE